MPIQLTTGPSALEYADFAGVIEDGAYGAAVIVWDTGRPVARARRAQFWLMPTPSIRPPHSGQQPARMRLARR
jgi:hypothetical protein